MAPSPCAHPRCPEMATYRGYCINHMRRREGDRNQKRIAQRKVYNSKRWRMTRFRQLFDNPRCECGAIASDVHHIVDLADGGDPYASSNLKSLCRRCHSQVTRRS